MKKTFLYLSIVLSCMTVSCKKEVNIFSINDDKELGTQVTEEILNNPGEYPILDRTKYASVYQYVEGIMNTILESNLVDNKSKFDWELTIIEQNVLNAFAAPGGKLFFYTGFLKYAESEAELAGVMAHEIAHSDRRHSTATMTKVYGLQTLLSVVLGNNSGTLKEIAATLALNGAALQFSQKHEYEADEYSVKYLNSVRSIKAYDPMAITDFFDHMKRDSLSTPNGNFEFLRTHPYDDNRKANVKKVWEKLGSPAGEKYESQYTNFKTSLP